MFNAQAAAVTTYDGVDHILGLAIEAVTDGIKAPPIHLMTS